MEIKRGDHVTIAGKVISVRKNHFIDKVEIFIQTKAHNGFWIEAEDIQTIRPMYEKER